jgi:hypothetical protein
MRIAEWGIQEQCEGAMANGCRFAARCSFAVLGSTLTLQRLFLGHALNGFAHASC